MTNEEICTQFMKDHYSDEKLAALLAHAEDGKLTYNSCCCLIGVLTADHPLRGAGVSPHLSAGMPHLMQARKLYGHEAEIGFFGLGENNGERRAKLIPLIRAEIARRDALRDLDAQTVAYMLEPALAPPDGDQNIVIPDGGGKWE